MFNLELPDVCVRVKEMAKYPMNYECPPPLSYGTSFHDSLRLVTLLNVPAHCRSRQRSESGCGAANWGKGVEHLQGGKGAFFLTP